MKINIGAFQMEVETFNLEGNLKKAKAGAGKAALEGCDILCYPELFLTGPVGAKTRDYAEELPGPMVDEFRELAARYGMHIVMGSIPEKKGDNYYNTSLLIDDTGTVLATYRKIHLWSGEKLCKSAGDIVTVCDTKFGKIGLEICWDVAFPELTKRMAMMGARMVFCPTMWSTEDRNSNLSKETMAGPTMKMLKHVHTESNFINTCVSARALENGIVFIYANGCGRTYIGGSPHNILGYSQVALPFYGRYAYLENEEDLLTAEIDLEFLDLAEEAYCIRRDTRLINHEK